PTRVGRGGTGGDATGLPPVLLRPGAVSRAEIEAVIGGPLAGPATAVAPTSPGQLASHYAPRAALRLNARSVQAGEALLAFGSDVPDGACLTINLCASGDLREAAANLFGALRKLDATGAETIAVMPVPDHGLGEAINDRLRRGAAAG
ncbi:MAG: Sua5 family C-terminal domain-containing protein, partial [Methyloligellaceae bacterium]